MPEISLGAYGFRFTGIDDLDPWLLEAPAHWPVVTVGQSLSEAEPEHRLDIGFAQVPLLGGGHLEVRRDPLRVEFVSRERRLTGAEIAHPFLAPAASILASWMGLSPIHGGAVIVEGRAWLLTGDRESGKSSTLAELAHRGVPVLADDLVVVGEDRARAGPRSLDLREGDLGVGSEDLGVVGHRRRWRLKLPPVQAEAPVGGVIHLGWARAAAIRSLKPGEVGGILESSAAMPLGPAQVLMMLALPTYSMERPRNGVAHTTDLVLDLIGNA